MYERTLASNALSIMIILAFFVVGDVNADYQATAAAERPSWTARDWWKYNVDFKGEMGLLGTMKIEVTSTSSEITQFGKTYECYQVDITGSGTVYGQISGQGITGTWTMNGESFYQKSDQSWVKNALTTEATYTSGTTSVTMRQVIEVIYNPPLEANKGFPLSVGGSWAAATTETTTTHTTINGVSDTNTDTKSYTNNYFVLRSEETTVSAGRFSTFVIRETDPEGSYSNFYYSAEVGTDVKEEVFDAAGQLQITMELIQFNYTSNSGSQWLPIVITLVAIIGLAVVVTFLRRRKPAAGQEQPPVPPEATQARLATVNTS